MSGTSTRSSPPSPPRRRSVRSPRASASWCRTEACRIGGGPGRRPPLTGDFRHDDDIRGAAGGIPRPAAARPDQRCLYALLSLGLAVIFGLLKIVNFAHGAMYMLGAF